LAARDTRDIVATFSIVAFDPETDALGVAVQSTFLAVGSIMPWARAGAGQASGGDSRGKQSAALLIVREGGGYGGDNDRVMDLRVDDHPEPIGELIRIRALHTLYFGETRPEDVVAVDGEVKGEVETSLRRLGYLEEGADDGTLLDALSAFIRTENFEEREQERGYLDRAVLEFMKEKR
jgi:uncharacterized Ntn-hydrolase superfamily protein